MTERFTNPHDDSHVSPQQLLLSALGKYLSPRNQLVRVVWGQEPSLLLGGDIKLRTNNGGVNKYGVTLSCDAWMDPSTPRYSDDPMYDIHLIGRSNIQDTATRYAVCKDGTYLAHPMGRLTVDRFTSCADERTVGNLVHLLHGVRFSERSTDGAYDYMSAWGVMEASGAEDVLYADTARYPYMDQFYQETGGQE